MTDTLFHMWGRFRQSLIDGHNFYLEQAQKRLLSQFNNIEDEAEKYAEEWLEKVGSHFDPDRHDPSDFYEQAHEESIAFYQMLDDLRNRTRLSVVAGLFHEWDKQVRDWITREINHWHSGEEANKALWSANFNDIVDLFEGLGWKIKSQSFYASLDRYRLVVNAYKHGNGTALQTIRDQHPDFISSMMRESLFIKSADYTDLLIEDKHIAEFSDAIIQFWKCVPEYIFNEDNLSVPKWFEKALQKDIRQTQTAKVS